MSAERLHSQERVRELLGRLARVKFLREQLDETSATWLVHPDRSRLDLGFIHRGRQRTSNGLENSAYAGLDIMGTKKTIGILVTSEETIDEDWTRLKDDPEIAHLMDTQEAGVAAVTVDQLEKWLRFYQAIESKTDKGDSLLDRLGRARAGELSGLTPSSYVESVQLSVAIESILGGHVIDLKSAGVAIDRMHDGTGGMDIAFVNRRGSFVPLRLMHYRDGAQDGEIVREWVEDEVDMVVGMALRKPGENKRDHYARVREMESELNRGSQRRGLRICAAGSGTVRLWKKLGMMEHPRGSFPEVGDQVLRAYRLLYLGEDNTNPGPLALTGLSLPGYGDYFDFDRLDGVFFRRNRHRQPVWQGIDNLIAMKGNKERVIGNVAGFVVFPETMSFDERERYVKPTAIDFNRRTGMVGANIWHLDRLLLDRIEAMGTPIVGEDEVSPTSAKRAVGYFVSPTKKTGPDDGILFRWWRQGPEVGGNRHATVVVRDGVESWTVGDVGYSFDQGTPIAFRGIGKQPATTDGLRRQLTYGDLPMIPELWEIWYLISTAKNWPGLADASLLERDPVARFVTGELFSRLKKEEIKEIFDRSVARVILSRGGECARAFRGERDLAIGAVVPTHSHYDHIGALPYIDKSLRQVVSGPMWATMIGLTSKAANWRNWYTRRADITMPIHPGQAYPRADVDLQVWWKGGQTMRLSPEIQYTPFIVDHPVPGTWQLFNINSLKVFVTGDWRPGEATARAMNALGGQNIDVVVMEATNLGEERKGNLTLREADVEKSFETMLRSVESVNKLVVAVVSPNSYERLSRLIEVAGRVGRNVALGESHAISAMEYSAVNEVSPAGAEGFEWVVPYGVLGENHVTVWAKKMSAPRAHHQSVRDLASESRLGLLTPERLVRRGEAGKWVVVVTPFEVLGDQFGNCGLDRPRLWWSAPSVYAAETRNFFRANKDWWTSSSVSGDWVCDFDVRGNSVERVKNQYGVAHVSGHANANEIYELLSLLISRGAKKVFAVHTDLPDEVKRLLDKKFGRKVEIITKFPKYDPRDPIRRPGAIFRLD